MADRHATVTWQGTLTQGHGTINSGSGALKGLPVTWASRMEAPEGKTSPEELLAAAEAECYAMVLTNMLTERGHSDQQLTVTATCTVQPQHAGIRITNMKLEVEGTAPGVDQQSFSQLAQEASENCPVSTALRGNVPIEVHATVKEGAGAGK